MFTVLAEPVRRSILDELRAADGCVVGELATRLDLPQPTVSKHLRVLRETGMVDVHVEAQQRRYRLRAGAFRDLETWLAPYRAFWNAHLDTLGEHLDQTSGDDR